MKFLALTVVIAVLVAASAAFVSNESHALPACVSTACPYRKSNPLAVDRESMLDLCKLIFGMVIDLLWSRAALEAEILVLRQQINVLRRASSKRPPFISIDRLILGGICRLFPKIYDALADCHRFYRLREMPSHAHCGAVSTSGNIQASAPHCCVIGEVVKDLHASL